MAHLLRAVEASYEGLYCPATLYSATHRHVLDYGDLTVRYGEESVTRDRCEENVLTGLKAVPSRFIEVGHKQRAVSNGDGRSTAYSYVPTAALLGLNCQASLALQ